MCLVPWVSNFTRRGFNLHIKNVKVVLLRKQRWLAPHTRGDGNWFGDCGGERYVFVYLACFPRLTSLLAGLVLS